MTRATTPKVALLVSPQLQQRIFSSTALQQLTSFAEVLQPLPTGSDGSGGALEDYPNGLLGQAEVLITGWGTSRLGDEQLDRLPHLRLIAHTAGSLRFLLSPSIFERGIRVTHSNSALAEGVAEFTVLQALLCLTRLHEFHYQMKYERQWNTLPPGRLLSAQLVGLVGAGQIGREVIKRLHPFGCRIQVFDPYLTSEQAQELGVARVDLETLCATSDIVSLHAPLLPQTRGMIQASHLALLRDGSIFLNTARARLVDEEELLRELQTGRFFAALDVFHQEPLPAESPLRSLPNVILSPHIAALTSDTLLKQGQMMIDEVQRFLNGEELLYEVKPATWSLMA
jgi:phosphoglycerate dehydrogenase-like enzyme